MARRRKPAVDDQAGQWPDWIADGPSVRAQCPEVWRLYAADPGSGPEQSRALITARGRWRRAVTAWCEEHDIDHRQVPGHRPVWE